MRRARYACAGLYVEEHTYFSCGGRPTVEPLTSHTIVAVCKDFGSASPAVREGASVACSKHADLGLGLLLTFNPVQLGNASREAIAHGGRLDTGKGIHIAWGNGLPCIEAGELEKR